MDPLILGLHINLYYTVYGNDGGEGNAGQCSSSHPGSYTDTVHPLFMVNRVHDFSLLCPIAGHQEGSGMVSRLKNNLLMGGRRRSAEKMRAQMVSPINRLRTGYEELTVDR